MWLHSGRRSVGSSGTAAIRAAHVRHSRQPLRAAGRGSFEPHVRAASAPLRHRSTTWRPPRPRHICWFHHWRVQPPAARLPSPSSRTCCLALPRLRAHGVGNDLERAHADAVRGKYPPCEVHHARCCKNGLLAARRRLCGRPRRGLRTLAQHRDFLHVQAGADDAISAPVWSACELRTFGRSAGYLSGRVPCGDQHDGERVPR